MVNLEGEITPEKPIVYLIGAGINQCIKNGEGLRPPLSKDLFKRLQESSIFRSGGWDWNLENIFAYINRLWKKSKEDLETQPLDMEEVFTYSFEDGNPQQARSQEVFYPSTIELQLKTVFSELLKTFDIPDSSPQPNDLVKFGNTILKEKSNVITFNYDCLLERAIEVASGINPENIDDKGCKYKWNRLLCYGFEADNVWLETNEGSHEIVPKPEFYRKNGNILYKSRVLKLHGSLNWFSSRDSIRTLRLGDEIEPPETVSIKILKRLDKAPVQPNGMYLGDFWDPLIITPILYKEYFFSRSPFPTLWNQALKILKKCKQLIVIGYSFPPTDFPVKKLFLNAFQDNNLDELVVVNPDTSIVKTVKDLTHFRKPVRVCESLKELLV